MFDSSPKTSHLLFHNYGPLVTVIHLDCLFLTARISSFHY